MAQPLQSPSKEGSNEYNPYRDSTASFAVPSLPQDGSDGLARPRAPFATGADPANRVSFAPPKSTGDLRLWRHDEKGNLWTKGGRGRCVGRFFCCTVMIVLLLIFSIVLALLMWVRPPDIQVSGFTLPSTGAVSVQSDGLHISVSFGISVKNPNFFGASFSKISAEAFYPPLTDALGGGEVTNLNLPANSDTKFTFPFNIIYTLDKDPNKVLFKDLVTKCGIEDPSSKSQLTVKYSITLGLRVLVATISPSFSGTMSFDCPVTRQDLINFGGEDLLKSLGVS